MQEEEIRLLIADLESDRIERTISFREDKLGPAVCALSNDFPNSKKSGYILLGVKDDGKVAGINIGDEELKKIGGVKTNGNVLPQPSIIVSEVFHIDGGDVVAVEVKPSLYPPVRYEGRCWIRVGPRRAIANVSEENILIERRASYAKTFDLVPTLGATLDDISEEYFTLSYLPLAIDEDTLRLNGRTTKQKMAALRFFDIKNDCPTNAGIIMFGLNPLFFLPGAYIQYIKFKGDQVTDGVEFEKQFSGALISELKNIDDFIKNNIIKEKAIRTDSFQEVLIKNYSYWALRELTMNAIMHRNYDSNAPIYIYEFASRIEIINSGGLYGDVTPNNFPYASDYRNVAIAEAMKLLGYVNRFNYGVQNAISELEKNGNGEPVFDLELITKFKVTISINKKMGSIKVITFFNNKGGVGKTTTVYHVAWMLSEMGIKSIAIDLDPQSNLTSMFLSDDRLETIYESEEPCTVLNSISPIISGDPYEPVHIEPITSKLGLILGDLALSTFEDKLSDAWLKCLDGDAYSFRIMSIFNTIINDAAQRFHAKYILIDVGPNLGAINRAVLLSSDYMIIPVASDLFSLQGIKNIGATLHTWKRQWDKRLEQKPAKTTFTIPNGNIKPAGYIVMQYSAKESRPVQSYLRWANRIPRIFKEYVLNDNIPTNYTVENDPNCIGLLKHYRSLAPMSMEAHKPIFLLKPADGAIGAHLYAVKKSYEEFQLFTENILTHCK